MKYKREFGLRRLIAELTLRSGVYTSTFGLALIVNYLISYISEKQREDAEEARDVFFIAIGIFLLFFSVLLALTAPVAVRKLFGGKITEAAPWLVGFEGVMPIEKLEKIIFGNVRGRLKYDSSSTPFCEREPYERMGREPAWVTQPSSHNPHPHSVGAPLSPPPLPPGHRFFTLVDTGELRVSIFSAARPPSVALVCGQEGGML